MKNGVVVSRCARGGTTLVELLVVLLVLGTILAIVGMSLPAPATSAADGDGITGVDEARRRATREGRSVSLTVMIDGKPRDATALPDGSVIGDHVLDLDRLTGRRRTSVRRSIDSLPETGR